MRTGWRGSAPDEVTELGADGNPVPSSLTPAEDLALRCQVLGACEYCGGPLTGIWSAGCGRANTVISGGSPGPGWSAHDCWFQSATVQVRAHGGGGGTRPEPVESESWRFCSKEHMDAFLAQRP